MSVGTHLHNIRLQFAAAKSLFICLVLLTLKIHLAVKEKVAAWKIKNAILVLLDIFLLTSEESPIFQLNDASHCSVTKWKSVFALSVQVATPSCTSFNCRMRWKPSLKQMMDHGEWTVPKRQEIILSMRQKNRTLTRF